MTPNFGPPAGGTAVVIGGANFAPGATATFGGSPATGVVWVDPFTLQATTPAGSYGTVDVAVTNPDAQFGTLTNGFTYETGCLANTGAETGIAPWIASAGFTAQQGGTGGFPTAYNGSFFFYAGSVASSNAYQECDVSAYAADIDAGAFRVRGGGYVFAAKVDAGE